MAFNMLVVLQHWIMEYICLVENPALLKFHTGDLWEHAPIWCNYKKAGKLNNYQYQ